MRVIQSTQMHELHEVAIYLIPHHHKKQFPFYLNILYLQQT